MEFNTSYLNRTPNKTARGTQSYKPEFVILHETAGYGSLNWNLRRDVRSSYNYLITRDGTIYHYVNERAYIAWHAGIASSARGYQEGELNVRAIGVEVEGPNDGTPITSAQTSSLVKLIHYFRDTYAIAISSDYYISHRDAAPSRKTDPRGYSVAMAIKLATEAAQPQPQPEPQPQPSLGAQLRNKVYRLAGGRYRPDWAFHQYAKKHDLGSPIKVGMDFTVKNQRYTGEVYGRDVVVSPYGQWQTVLRARQVSDSELFDSLMRFAYGALGVDFRPDQAFYHFVRRHPVGIPLTESVRLKVPSGAAFATQLYTFDTLYTPIEDSGATDWSNVFQLSGLKQDRAASDNEKLLRDVVYKSMYRRVGDDYDAGNPFVSRGVELGLGAPLTAMRQWTFEGTAYCFVVYAGDTLLARQDNLQDIWRLSAIPD